MRPLRLDLAGFTVFREPTTIDFTDADFFALVGPTGSGKSTVLDAICFALYGTVPRWGGSRGIANALAPSAVEARVRLVFDSAGSRYVATRVVRRDSRGNVKTGNAGLQRMPDGFDVTKLDTGMSPEDLGEALAGTPAQMDEAVLTAVGLPYEQFTSCVVLPQGQFADFLHAKPATRQQILINLLGLGVYERVQQAATGRAVGAEAQLAAVNQVLQGLTDADEETLTAATEHVGAMHRLADDVRAAVPELERARAAADAAAARLTALDGELAELDRIHPPADVAAVARAVTDARAVAAETVAAVTLAEEREEKVRGELASAGDQTMLRLLLQAHTERDRVAAEAEALGSGLTGAETDHTAALAALDRARTDAERASVELEAARRAYQEAQTADRAAALRGHLAAGEPCPVCEQEVHVVPAVPAGSAVTAAEAAGHTARTTADAATKVLTERERAARALERDLDRARARHDQLAAALSELDTRLADSPGPAALRRELAALDRLRGQLDQAGTAVRTAREASRRARTGVEAAEERVRLAGREFDTARDRIARLGPPAADRDDLAAAWEVLRDWAQREADRRRADRVDAASAVAQARAAADTVAAGIAALFTAAGVPAGNATGRSGTDPVAAAAVAVVAAEAEQRRLAQRREQADQLTEKRVEHERAARTARSLAGHLRANNFERWLLAEALDLLVDGASRILRELTGGQYELTHDKGEFYVVDQHDAGLRRGVRTLSGGETFQASLALALALSEQLAGLSTTTASLESILLDEGFGTLDVATLDTVAATLETLAARGDRMVGVVTHVPALAERVPVRYEVSKDARTARVERIG
ncbi:SMC family ATPase [Micromonospora sp. NBC_01796]|uniref:SMC family ATPase n=1 Tax=Micromonospora sp. NBC_01796 TaxID=2975987 RepID=UPI002DD827F5|nr:SMC family ATPase [Micromonospora sp. NBC_01796]WSA86815.1 SMC family ATPase [Micromonospora sp. NBC_01796]